MKVRRSIGATDRGLAERAVGSLFGPTLEDGPLWARLPAFFEPYIARALPDAPMLSIPLQTTRYLVPPTFDPSADPHRAEILSFSIEKISVTHNGQNVGFAWSLIGQGDVDRLRELEARSPSRR